MTLEDKAGLVMMAPVLASDSPQAVAQLVRDHRPGGLLLLGDGWDSAAKVQATVEAAQAAAGGGLWIAADQEGGKVQRLKGSGFDVIASAVELGRLGLDELESRAAVWGAQLAAAGVNLDLAPVVDSVDAAARAANRPIGALDRDFGLDPAGDAAHAAAFIRGLASAGVGSAVKHFPGLGRVAGNTDFTDQGVEDAVTEAGDPAVEAFATALAAGPTMVMVSLATYTRLDPAAPAAFSPAVVTDLLRGQLGWDGVVVSDSLTAAAAQSVAPADRAVKLIQAGGDLATFGDQTAVAPAIAGLIAAAKADQSLAAALDASARRLIAAKLRAGLIDANP
jgi:beta-N-acetylhexosaminidase